ncbi:MAG: DUF2298 domain-containing protein [Anaerolineae bacterium]|nr:DUF2298 domain-containing protein [Anaerolineae bacterium]
MIIWYLTLQLFALAGLPLAFAWLRNLPSRGYAVAKSLGLLLSGLLFWWGNILHLWPNRPAAILTSVGLIFALGIWQMRGHWPALRAWWQTHRTFILLTEVLFALAYLGWAAVRATQPQIATAGGEKWMEIAFLNALLRSPAMPPHDPWLSGYAISYYYLGYLLLALPTQLSGLPSAIAFNLGNAAWFALAAVAAYGVLYDLRKTPRPGAALLAPLLLLLPGNGTALAQLLHARGLLPAAFWRWLDIRGLAAPPTTAAWLAPPQFDWWRASRTLHDYAPISTAAHPLHQEVIDEFPAFSFILGDMHPHLLALPFVLLAIALALNLWRRPATFNFWGNDESGPRPWSARFRFWSGYGLVIGALGFLNTWDLPIYLGLTVAVLLLRARRQQPTAPLLDLGWQLLPDVLLLGVYSILLYLPFWIGLRSQAGGILPNLFNATHWPQFAVMFLPLLLPLLGVLHAVGRRAELRWLPILGQSVLLLGGILLGSLLLGALVGTPYLQAILRGEPLMGQNVELDVVIAALTHRLLHPWTAWLLLTGVVALLTASLRPRTPLLETDLAFPALLALLGLGLTLAPEFIFLKDIFSTRMNTIFKFYFQAWVCWSLAGAWWLTRKPTHTMHRIALTASTLLIMTGLLYPLYAIPARASQNRNFYGEAGAGTLDGAAWLAEKHHDGWAAIHWLNAHIDGRPVILETPGDQHKAYVYEGRVAAFTGLPAVLGWAGHEYQWRGNYDEQARREQDLEVLFTTLDPALTRELLARYHVTYIYLGPTERNRYPAPALAKFAELFPVVYQNDGVTIYQAPKWDAD